MKKQLRVERNKAMWKQIVIKSSVLDRVLWYSNYVKKLPAYNRLNN